MQLSQLEAFLAVLKHGSLAAAGRALGQARTRLQTQLDQLEEELGHKLLVRGPRGAVATRAGETFAPRARALLTDARSLRHCLDDAPQALRLRIAMEPGLPPSILAMGAQLLRVRLEDTEIEVVVCSAQEGMADPEIDLIWGTGIALPKGAFRTFVVQRVPVRLLASPAYLDARGRPDSVEELAEHDLLAWTGSQRERARLWPRPDGTTFSVKPVLSSNDAHLIRTLANAGLGIALTVDAPQVRGTLVGDDLEFVLDGVVGEMAKGRVLIPDRAAEAPAVRQLMALTRELGLEEIELPTM